MQIIQVVPAISEEASGPSYSVPRLCDALISGGAAVKLASLHWSEGGLKPPYLATFALGFGPRRLGVSPSMLRWLREEIDRGRADLIHSHGLWMMPNVYPAWACRNHSCRLVVSPRGTLSKWALGRSALRKTLFWYSFQRPALSQVTLFHATAQSEYEDIRRLGFKQPVCIVPNGIDVPPLVSKAPRDRRRLLFLGRIHPKKGVDILLRAWSVVSARFPQWDLYVVGPDNAGYRPEMMKLADRLRLPRVNFKDSVYGQDKVTTYQMADLFVLPTHSENFAITVAEALAAGTPAIVTRGAPWAELATRRAGWSIDIGVEPLVACLEGVLAMPQEQLEKMGRAGREWMRQDYGWDHVASRHLAAYSWMLNGGPPPPWVCLS